MIHATKQADQSVADEYRIVWRYTANPEREPEFLVAYRADGLWTELFRRSEAYLGSELTALHDGSYRTIDRWRSAEDWQRFLAEHGAAYLLLDEACEELTLDERKESP
ncbi:MAG: hypothetical protein ACREVL_09195 [Solimonas sp.]